MSSPQKIEVSLDLLKKYNRPGPRYTSYPTAPHFHEDFGPKAFREEIVQTNADQNDTDLSLYFHLPFCHTLCYFCGCNMIVTHNPVRVERYLEYLKKEIRLVSGLLSKRRRVIQLHWGGGTPTYLNTAQIRDIFGFIKNHFSFSDTAEISIEIDPRTLSPDHLSTLREVGFNRVSFGVQDFNSQVQEVINRIQPYEQNEYVIEESRRLNYDSINVDLIYGLPHQTLASYRETLDKVIELSPDRLAVFNYAHVPWLKKHQRVLPEAAMPDATTRLELLKLIIERLTDAGYVYIGMDHFAKPDDELTRALQQRTLYRNFQGYSTHSHAEVYALGITAISQLKSVYAQNVKQIKEYEGLLDQEEIPTQVGVVLSRDDQIRRYVITEMMCNNRILKADLREKFGVEFDRYFPDVFEKMEEFVYDGLVSITPEGLEVSEAGRLVIRNIAMVFDAYLEQNQPAEKPLYSRTV